MAQYVSDGAKMDRRWNLANGHAEDCPQHRWDTYNGHGDTASDECPCCRDGVLLPD